MPHYRLGYGYDKEDVERFMKVFHEYDSKTGSFQPFDFTLTTFWGEAAEKAGLASPIKYVLFEDGDLVGLFQGLVQKKLFYRGLRAGSTSGNGIAMLPSFSQSEMSLFLKKILERERFSALSIFSPISLNIPRFSEKMNYTFYIHLNRDLDEIFRKMKSTTRNRINRARKSGVTVDFSGTAKALEGAYNVINSTLNLRSFPALPRRYVVELHECFKNPPCESKVALAYEKGGNVIAAVHLIGFDRKILFWQAGSTEKGYKLNAGSLVQAEIIAWTKNQGYLIYDMGGTDPVDPIFAGIHRFKLGFGGSLVANTIIQKDAFYAPFIRKAYSFFKSIQVKPSLVVI